MEHFHWEAVSGTCLAPFALDSIFKDAEVLLPPGGERRGETCLGSLNVSPFDRVKTFQTRLSRASLVPARAGGWEGATTGAGSPGSGVVAREPGVSLSLWTPRDARPGTASRVGPSPHHLPRHKHRPGGCSGYPSWQWGGESRGGLERGRASERAPKLQTAQLQLQVSGLSLEAIINLRFIFIGEPESRLTLAKQGSSGRPWMRLNAGEYFCRKAVQARLL